MSASQLSRRRLKVKKSEPVDLENAETDAGHAASDAASASEGSENDDDSE